MSVDKSKKNAQRWIDQAKDDLAAAHALASHDKFAQACFLCQQSGEKMVKAVWFFIGEDPWGHSVLNLINELPKDDLRASLTTARLQAASLDKLYIPTRYPNGLPDLAPMDAYGRQDFDSASKAVQDILSICERIMVS